MLFLKKLDSILLHFNCWQKTILKLSPQGQRERAVNENMSELLSWELQKPYCSVDSCKVKKHPNLFSSRRCSQDMSARLTCWDLIALEPRCFVLSSHNQNITFFNPCKRIKYNSFLVPKKNILTASISWDELGVFWSAILKETRFHFAAF